jgi:AcrR family transcriptional regulator
VTFVTYAAYMTSSSRREEYAAATRQAILDAAAALFADKGFVATSLDQVAKAARVTRGAVYHHFENKQALFLAVLEALDAQTMAVVAARSSAAPSTWEAAIAGLDAFLERCLDRTYQRICFEEGPTALGFVAWWQHGERHMAGAVAALLDSLKAEGLVDLDDVAALGTVVYGAITAGALDIARSEDQSAAAAGVRTSLIRILEGLKPAGRRTS